MARVIEAHDANGDGQLQQEEWSTLNGEPAHVDTNRDGVITSDEFVRYVHLFGARRRIRLVSPEPTLEEPVPPLLQPTSSGPEGNAARKKETPDEVTGDSPQARDGSLVQPRTRQVKRRRDSKFFVPEDRLPSGLPTWFHTQDRDGDGQITMAEYSPEVTAATVAIFRRYDTNGDGVITSGEYLEYLKAAEKVKSDKKTGSSLKTNG
ncbi:MAG: hypothetical protein ACC628_14535 [Pirellulaceae bacterium]